MQMSDGHTWVFCPEESETRRYGGTDVSYSKCGRFRKVETYYCEDDDWGCHPMEKTGETISPVSAALAEKLSTNRAFGQAEQSP